MPTALIWGASGGIGASLTKLLDTEGWQVYGVARDETKINLELDAIIEFEASDFASIQSAMMQVAQETDELDLVVYAVGDLVYERLSKMDHDGWLQTLNSNLSGAFYVANQTLPLLRKGGSMIFIGAYIDHVRIPKMGAYAVAKAALDELVAMLAKENRRHKFMIVRPGAVDTAFWENVSFSMPDDAKSPDIVANAILNHYQNGEDGDINL